MTTQELNIELSKHRKLLHRAVGNRIIPHINFHHYEIVRLIGEIKSAEDLEFSRETAWIIGDAGFPVFSKLLSDALMKAEDELILKGQFQVVTGPDGNYHNDIHLPK